MTAEEIKAKQAELDALQPMVSTETANEYRLMEAVLEVALQLAELRKDLTIRKACDTLFKD